MNSTQKWLQVEVINRFVFASSQAKTVVFVDETEASLKVNKDRGINAPGWWSYYTDSSIHQWCNTS